MEVIVQGEEKDDSMPQWLKLYFQEEVEGCSL